MENLERITKIKNILSQYWKSDEFTLISLNTDASSRKYYRSTCSDKSIIVMDDDGCSNQVSNTIHDVSGNYLYQVETKKHQHLKNTAYLE